MTEATFGILQNLAKKHLHTLPAQNQSPRSQILTLSVLIGGLSLSFLDHAPLDLIRENVLNLEGNPVETRNLSEAHPSIQSSVGNLLWALCMTGTSCKIDLRSCILKKVQLNARKYPVELCKGNAGKYTKYSMETGITKGEGQSTMDEGIPDDTLQSIADISAMINKFSTDRQWDEFHTPRNLVFALNGEFGELAELFQWKGDGKVILTDEELDSVGQELADITIYLLRLAHVCSIPVGDLAMIKANNVMYRF